MLCNYDVTKLCFDYISLFDVGKDIVCPTGYFSHTLCVDNFAISTLFPILQSLAYDILVTDVINKLDILQMNAEFTLSVNTIILTYGYITIVEKFQ